LFRNQAVSLGTQKNGGRLFRRPKLTLSCSAEGKKGRKEIYLKAPYMARNDGSKDGTNNGFERMWKEKVVAQYEVL
jgi:hypothetical protein